MESQRRQYLKRWAALKNERSSWVSHWQEISTFILPRSGRFFVGDRNRGGKRHNQILDPTSTRSLKILAAGMMAGMTSPARPWFRLTMADTELAKFQPVKVWLAECTRILLTVFAKSNTYRTLHTHYMELGTFGTCAGLILDDFENVIHHTPLTTGEYCIATNFKGEVTTLYREFEMTVAQMVAEFGYDNCSQMVRNLFDRKDLDVWIGCLHVIEPREDRDTSKRDNRNMAWKSCYLETGRADDKMLRESGFKRFPGIAARWDVLGGDIYGNSPGMEALGGIKGLQHKQLRKAEAIDYMTKPPLQVPASMVNQAIDILPGGISYYDEAGGPGKGVRSMFDVNLRLDHLLPDIQDTRQLIRESFFADLFLMLANMPGDARMTATEVAERHEEKMLMLGPTVERLHNEALNPMVDGAFSRLWEAGALPPPPDEVVGHLMEVIYTSVLAQAQRAIATNSIDRFVLGLGTVAAIKPEIVDKLDADHYADAYAEALGVDPELVVANDKVALIRENRAKAQAAAQQAAQANLAADTAQKLGNSPTNSDTALGSVLDAFQGYT